MSDAATPLGIEIFARERDERRIVPPARSIGQIYGGELIIVEVANKGLAVFDPITDEVTPLNSSREALTAYLAAFDVYFSTGPAARELSEAEAMEKLVALTEGIKIPTAKDAGGLPHRKRARILLKSLKQADRGALRGWWENIVDEVKDNLI